MRLISSRRSMVHIVRCTRAVDGSRRRGEDEPIRESCHVPDRARRAPQARPEHHGLAARRPVTRGTKKRLLARKQGTRGVEPRTCRSAVDRSTTEL